MKPLDLDAKELLEALAAHRLGWWPADSVSFAATVWVSGGEGPREAMSAVLTAAQVRAASAAAGAALEARNGDAIAAMGDLCADAAMARDLLVLPIPADWAKALRVVVQKSKEAAVRASEAPREIPSALSRDVTSTVVIGPASVDRYTLGKEIGRGGLGSVVEAQDHALNREVAIKLALDNMPGEQQSRFVREVELTARLEHPNVVPVHDFGVIKTTGGGRHMFLCMKRIRGRDLGMLLKELARGNAEAVAATSRARLLAIFQDVCQGVAFAHSRGVIHRDLKPANVMLGEFGETLIVDWGIAKVKGETQTPAAAPRSTRKSRPDDPSATVVLQSDDTSLTLEGDVVGTPAYMSPEQAAGRLADVDERSDVWSLGVILFELLTLQLPFEGMSTAEVLAKVRAGKFPVPSALLQIEPPPEACRAVFPPVPPELDAVVQRALSFRRDDRFSSALDLHREIQLFLEGASDLERRRKQAASWTAQGRKRLERFRGLHEEVVKAAAQVRELESSVKLHEPIEAKRPYREAKERLASLQEERVEAFSAAAADFGHALAVDASMDEAAAGLCDLHYDWFLEAEREKNHEDMLFHRRALEVYDRTGEFRAKLDAPGTLSIRTLAWECDCLAPEPGRAVAFEDGTSLMWSDGLTRPGEAIKDWAQPVPKATSSGKFGHTAACALRAVKDVRVTAAKIVEKDTLMVPGEPRDLGVTPLERIALEPGSWLCTLTPADPGLAPVRLPVRIERAIEWSQDVRLLPAKRVPAGFVAIPGGPFIHSGPEGGGGPEEARTCADFLVATFPVTSAEYLEYLNDRATREPLESVAKRAPRDAVASVWPAENGRFRLPELIPGTKMKWDPALPVFAISWSDALHYCAWRSARDGRFYTVPHEVQFEKAARGVDGRVFPFGNVYDGTFANTNSSFGDGFRLLPVGAMPADVSPYGVRDLAGNMGTWCLNSIAGPFAAVREYKGGAWSDVWHHARSPSRMGAPPAAPSRHVGIRLVMPIFAYA